MEQQKKEKEEREKKEKEEAEKREKQKYVKKNCACIKFKLHFGLFCYSLIQCGAFPQIACVALINIPFSSYFFL